MKSNNLIKFLMIFILVLIISLMAIFVPWKKIVRYGEKNLVSGNRSIIY